MTDSKQEEQRAQPGTPPLSEQYLARLKGHRAVAVLIVVGTVVAALASFTDATSKLAAAFHRQRPEEARQELARLSVPFTPEAFSDAAGKGDLTVTKLFLASDMPVDDLSHGEAPTALLAAVHDNRPKVVELLLKAGADPALHAGNFLSPLEVAARQGNTSVVTILLDSKPIAREAIDSAFLRAAEGGQPEMLQFLKGRGADVSALATQALVKAVFQTRVDERRMTDTVAFLLQAGADIEARSGESDWTPLHAASRNSKPAVVRLLLDRGAVKDARDRDGCTPLWWAAGIGRLDEAALLLSKGADANARDKDGMTVLDRAKFNSDKNMIELLREHGAK